MAQLYPPVEPYAVHQLEVDTTHTLYLEECGNPDGIPVVFLHGGPGAGCEPYHRRFFDPRRYRILLFDQRGCGRSTPHAELAANSTWHLVADMERIRTHLHLASWMLFGGSWGSTLALAYAETHPQRVLALILRGIFLCRREEIRWFYQEGANFIFPDYWEAYLAPIPQAERGDLLRAYHQRLTGRNEVARMAAAKAWSRWEGRTVSLLPNENIVDFFTNPHTALSLARIECHYFVNDTFLKPSQLLGDADRLAGIPGIIIHGRYDIVCPLRSGWELHQAWTDSELRIIPDAGHAASEPSILSALVEATDQMAESQT